MRTCKLGLYALAHETKLYIIQGPEDIGGHDCLFVLERRNLVGAVVESRTCQLPPVGFLGG